jgi:hypothetical protein
MLFISFIFFVSAYTFATKGPFPFFGEQSVEIRHDLDDRSVVSKAEKLSRK